MGLSPCGTANHSIKNNIISHLNMNSRVSRIYNAMPR